MSFENPFLQKLSSFKQDLNALIYDDKVYTYENLLKSVKAKMSLIENLDKNLVLGLVGDFDIDSLGFLFACLEIQRVIALFSDKVELEAKAKEANVYAIFENNKLNLYQNRGENHNFIAKLNAQKQAGLILFSSGSTGKPKAIVHNFNTLCEIYLDKKAKNINILLFLMFDHIGGLNTLLNCLAMGACGVAIKDRKNLQSIGKAIEKYQISLLPTSPSFLNLILLSKLHLEYDLSSLRLITYGTEAMSDVLLQRLKDTFKKVRFHQTFGTSEVGISQTKSYENYIKLENLEYKIINNELFLKSKTQSLGYLNADNSAFKEDGFFATGDLVELININGEEYLKIIGRNKELINVGGEKVLPSEVEGVILQMSDVLDCLVYGEKNAITGQSVCVKLVLKDESDKLEFKKKLRAFCKDKLANFKIPSKLEIVKNLELNSRFKRLRK